MDHANAQLAPSEALAEQAIAQSARTTVPGKTTVQQLFSSRVVEVLDRVRAVLRTRSTEASSIDDAIQQTGLALLERQLSLEHFSVAGLFRYALCAAENWLRNAHRDTARRRVRDEEWTMEHARGAPCRGDPDELFARTKAAQVQLHSLECLQPELREVFLARHVYGLSAARASKRLGIPEGTFKSRLIRARDILRDLCTEPERTERTTPFSPRKAAPRSREPHARAEQPREQRAATRRDAPETAEITPRQEKDGTRSGRG